jgi:hypothetical protein
MFSNHYGRAMLHQPPIKFSENPASSRIAHLAAEYERWQAFYRHTCLLDEKPDKSDEEKERLRIATFQAVRCMHAAMDEITMTPARSLTEFGQKARIVRDSMSGEWYEGEEMDRGERLAATMMVELIEIAGLNQLQQRDLEPVDLLEGYVDPTASFQQAAE